MKERFCVKCGKKFMAIGRQVICPDCKAQAEEETKRAAVERAKRASWAGESVPVRISGRASTVIRKYGAARDVPFAEALDELLKSTSFFEKLGVEWSTVVPYKSHRRDKHAAEDTNKPQEAQAAKQEEVKQEAPQASKQAAKTTSKTSTAKKAVKTAAGKASASKK